jgi:hypothetical protein
VDDFLGIVCDGVDMTGRCLSEKLGIQKIPRAQAKVQLFVVAHSCHYRMEVQKWRQILTGL